MHELQGLFQSQQIRLSEKARIEGSSAEHAPEWLNKVLLWNYDRLESDRERFLSVYSPVSILPPDQYLSLVLQATEGCHWNRCTFCDFYSQTRFQIKSEEEFASHITVCSMFSLGFEVEEGASLSPLPSQ